MKDLRKIIFKRDNYQCVYCGTDQNLTLGHYISRYNKGHACEDNLQAECRSCNIKNGKEDRKGGIGKGCWGCNKPTMRNYYKRKSKEGKLVGYSFECYNCNNFVIEEKRLEDILIMKNNHFDSCETKYANKGYIEELTKRI